MWSHLGSRRGAGRPGCPGGPAGSRRPGDGKRRVGTGAGGRAGRARRARTQSGCRRASSESGLTISGSTQSPNCMPRPRTWSASGPRPCGHTPASTFQSPRPAVSSRRPGTSRRPPRGVPRRSRRPARRTRQPVEVVVEVEGLPGVEHQRPRGWGGRAGPDSGAAAARPSRPSALQPYQHSRGAVGLAGGEPDLARVKQFAAAEHGRVPAPAPSGSRSTR